MTNLQEFKCPCCGGSIEFNSKNQNMKCPYCDTEFEIDALRDLEEEIEQEKNVEDDVHWDTTAGGTWANGEADGISVYICASCAGEIVGDDTLSATQCPFCGNPVIIKGNFAGELRPDLVLPFKLDKKAAKEGLERHLHGKKLLPKIFKDQNHIDEIRGIYVPFWLFDADAEGDIRYKATRVRHWSDRNYRYTETSYFSVRRAGRLSFENIPVDGSEKIPNDLMESIEPFDYSSAVDFETAYLSGFFADKYDVSADESIPRATERVKRSTETAFADTIHGYSSVIPESSHISLHKGSTKYALCPVWILNTTWNGQRYTFAMNGQTGKFVGDLPVDNAAYWRTFGIIGALASAVSFAFLYFFLQ